MALNEEKMKAFGFTRTHARCRVCRAGRGKKIVFAIYIKNRKRGRRISREGSE